jgi:hypothetical protein
MLNQALQKRVAAPRYGLIVPVDDGLNAGSFGGSQLSFKSRQQRKNHIHSKHLLIAATSVITSERKKEPGLTGGLS